MRSGCPSAAPCAATPQCAWRARRSRAAPISTAPPSSRTTCCTWRAAARSTSRGSARSSCASWCRAGGEAPVGLFALDAEALIGLEAWARSPWRTCSRSSGARARRRWPGCWGAGSATWRDGRPAAGRILRRAGCAAGRGPGRIEQVEGIGRPCESVARFFADARNRKEIDRLRELGVEPKQRRARAPRRGRSGSPAQTSC